MSAQTPQTDALVIAADGCKSVYPGEEFKPNPDWKFEPEIDAIIALSRTLEADRDRLKALCEELREALEETITEISWFVSRKKDLGEIVNDDERKRWADVLDSDLDIARAALKKAQKP